MSMSRDDMHDDHRPGGHPISDEHAGHEAHAGHAMRDEHSGHALHDEHTGHTAHDEHAGHDMQAGHAGHAGHAAHGGHDGHGDHVGQFRRLFWIMLVISIQCPRSMITISRASSHQKSSWWSRIMRLAPREAK